MGIAAYYRGNKVISDQLRREYDPHYHPDAVPAKPVPRPATWGDKASQRALERARGIVAGALKYGMRLPDVEMLTEIVIEKARVGRDTATAAAVMALEEGENSTMRRNPSGLQHRRFTFDEGGGAEPCTWAELAESNDEETMAEIRRLRVGQAVEFGGGAAGLVIITRIR